MRSWQVSLSVKQLEGKTTIIEEITIVKGEPVTKTTKKIEPANAALAHKILQTEDPVKWAEIKRVEIDWRKEIQEHRESELREYCKPATEVVIADEKSEYC